MLNLGNKTKDGVVVAIATGSFYFKTSKQADTPIEDHPWSKEHQNWTNEPVYAILLDTPRVPFSFEQYQSFYPEMPEEVAIWHYNREPRTLHLWVPEFAFSE